MGPISRPSLRIGLKHVGFVAAFLASMNTFSQHSGGVNVDNTVGSTGGSGGGAYTQQQITLPTAQQLGVSAGAFNAAGLNDEERYQYTQELMGLQAKYDAMNADLQSQKAAAQATLRGCETQEKKDRSDLKDQARQNKANAIMPLVQPGMTAAGTIMANGLATSEQGIVKREARNQLVASCASNTKAYWNGASWVVDPRLERRIDDAEDAIRDARNKGATADVVKSLQKNLDDLLLDQTGAQSRASSCNTQLQKADKELADIEIAKNSLTDVGIQLMASGLGGMVMKHYGDKGIEEQAELVGLSREECNLNAMNMINTLNAQELRLAGQKANEISMLTAMVQMNANNRRAAESLVDDRGPNVNIEDPGLVSGEQKKKIEFAKKSAGAGGASPGGAAGTGGGGAGEAPFVFGGGGSGGGDGGSPLPNQPDATGFKGTAAGAMAGMGGGGFGEAGTGKGAAGEAAAVTAGPSRGLASYELGDGGLNVLLTRNKMILARYSPVLLKNITMPKLAAAAPVEEKNRKPAEKKKELEAVKSQGIQGLQ